MLSDCTEALNCIHGDTVSSYICEQVAVDVQVCELGEARKVVWEVAQLVVAQVELSQLREQSQGVQDVALQLVNASAMLGEGLTCWRGQGTRFGGSAA